MKRFIKGFLIFLGILVSVTLILVVWWNIAAYQRHEKAKRDFITFSKICDTVQIVTEQPEIGISGFGEKEIKQLKFEIKRNGKIVADTLLHTFSYIADDGLYRSVKIPFSVFKKTDTIIITTANKLKFFISGFYYYSRLHYGMFGYAGGGDCSLSNTFKINKSNGSSIYKEIAFSDAAK